MKSGQGARILIFGILSLVCCGPIGIIAWIQADQALNSGNYADHERGLIIAGKVLGIVGIVFCCCGGGIFTQNSAQLMNQFNT